MTTTRKKASFEEQMQELDQIVNQLEQGNVPLEEALKQFKEGMTLANKLQKKLTSAQNTLAKVMDESGNEQPYEKAGDDPTNAGSNQGYDSDLKDI
ncbi:exodeoxyribonuclease VII small subunit [Limosilactobacillus difficilis]|uniref:exodeoxyribonuclease VII small subunit n=1 Tax=Limosilactobacillus difficilis TaxID=2991838 RepID=UPI0024BA39A6|nr:exodeoxyribonuclease VII small subunit [Limosilactobacillus difficilis]